MYKQSLTFHQLMKFTLYLQYVGFSVPAFTIRNDKTLVVKNIVTWFELVIPLVVACTSYFILSPKKKLQEIDIITLLTWAVQLTSFAFSLVTGWEMKTKSQLLKSVFENIKALNKIPTLESKQLNQLTVKVAAWSIAIISGTATSIVTFSIFGGSTIQKIVGIIACVRMYVAPATHLIQFFTLITLVRLYLEWVGKQLDKIRQLNLDGKRECHPYTIFRPHFRESDDCKTANNIENIRKIYGRVHDLKRDINEIYTLRLWMDTTNTILQVLCFIYINLTMLRNSNDKSSEGTYFVVYYLRFWIAFLILKFLETVRICGQVTESGKNIGVKVHEIFSRSYCESVGNELTTFSLELLHRNPYIKANNIFHIDYPLTASVVRGVIMELIALLQINVPDSQGPDIRNVFASDSTNITTENPSPALTTTNM